MRKRFLVGLGLALVPALAWAGTEIIGGGGGAGGLPTSGGTLTGEVVVDNLGLEFTAGDDFADCSTFAATNGGLFFDDSEGIFKKCQDNVLTDLDTAGSHTGTIVWGGTAILESSTAFQFGDASDATLTHTYGNTGTNTTVAWSSALATFSHGVTVVGTSTLTGETDVGTSPTIFSNTNITMQLDENADGTNSFIINDGADAAIFTFGEAGTLTWGGTAILETGDALQIGDGTDATVTHTYNVSTGTDPVVAYTNNSIDFSVPVTGTSFVADASATPQLLLQDSTTSGEVSIEMTDAAGPEGAMQLKVDTGAGTLTTFIDIDGINNDIELGTPGSNYVDITTAGVLTFVGTGDIVLPGLSINAGDFAADIIDADDLNDVITLEDGSLVDFGTLSTDASEGLRIPAHATDCTTATAEGQICWEEGDKALYVGDGATAQQMNTAGGDVTDVFSCGGPDCASITMAATDLLNMSGVDASTATEGLILPQHATACAGGTAEGQVCWEADANILHIGDASTIVDFVPTSAFSGDAAVSTAGVVTLQANAVDSAEITAASVDSSHMSTQVRSMYWGAGAMEVDGTQCAAPTAVALVTSGPTPLTIACADSDAGTISGSTSMPDSWDGGTVVFTLIIGQIGASTNGIELDFEGQCIGSDEAFLAFAGTGEQAAAITLTADDDMLEADTSAVTLNGSTCAGGDTLVWRGAVDATASHADIATAMVIVGVKMEYTSNVGD